MALDRMPILPQYQVENYHGLPVQDEFREHVLEDLKERHGNWSTKIASACVRNRHLPLRPTIRLAPDTERPAIIDLIRQEITLGILVPPQREHASDIAFAPACLGIINARDESVHDCQACPFNLSCRSLVEKAEQNLMDRFGTASPLADPRRERERKSRNERQQRFRDRKKSNALAAAASA